MDNQIPQYNPTGFQVTIIRKGAPEIVSAEFFNVRYFSVVMVRSGSLSLTFNTCTMPLSANELLIIPLNNACRIETSSKQPEIYLFSFTQEFAFSNSIKKPFIGFFDIFITRAYPAVLLKKEEVSRLKALFKLLKGNSGNVNRNPFKNEVLLFNFNALLYEIAGHYQLHFQNITVKQTRKEKLVVQFFQILEGHCKKEHGVAFYADAIFITAVHLSRTVKEITGSTAKQCIEQALILEAKILLEDNNRTVMQIMEELAFSSMSFFSTFFKRHTSMSPNEYRLSLRF